MKTNGSASTGGNEDSPTDHVFNLVGCLQGGKADCWLPYEGPCGAFSDPPVGQFHSGASENRSQGAFSFLPVLSKVEGQRREKE